MLRRIQPPGRPDEAEDDETVITLTVEEARALKSLADLGAGEDYVTPKRIASHMLRRLRERDLAILLAHPTKGTQATLTNAGVTALPLALKVIAAAAGASR